MRQREIFDEHTQAARKKAVESSYANLMRSKDVSIEKFMQNFTGSLLTPDKKIRSLSDTNLSFCISAVQDVLLAGVADYSYE